MSTDQPMMITVDRLSAVPTFEQLRSQISDRIRSGALLSGDRLPSIRQLAGDLRIAPGTVARTYAELESAGLIETSRTRGTRVRSAQIVDAEVVAAAARLVAAALRSSASLDDALGLVRTEWTRAITR